uniref:hypothetical protein n=1 Tax=Bacillus pumilus TaxID=1408 RepID=UPI001C9317BD
VVLILLNRWFDVEELNEVIWKEKVGGIRKEVECVGYFLRCWFWENKLYMTIEVFKLSWEDAAELGMKWDGRDVVL